MRDFCNFELTVNIYVIYDIINGQLSLRLALSCLSWRSFRKSVHLFIFKRKKATTVAKFNMEPFFIGLQHMYNFKVLLKGRENTPSQTALAFCTDAC